jgi:hypothetical protein
MNAYASSSDRYTPFQRNLEDLLNSVEAELHQAAAYVDRVIVPEVRREAGTAARTLARHLDRLADHLYPLNGSDAPNSPEGKSGL